MKRLKPILIGIGTIIGIIVIIGFLLPSNYQVKKSIVIDRPVELVYFKSLDFRERIKWDPWMAQEKDADVQIDITENGVGSTWSWQGEKIGSGKITVENVVINEKIESRLEFFEPDTSASKITWTFAKAGNGTDVTWKMEGSWNGIFHKWIGFFIKSSIENSFEQGLKNFKEYVEKLPELAGKSGEIQAVNLDRVSALIVKKQTESKNMQEALKEAYGKLMKYFETNNIERTGSPFVVFNTFDPDGKTSFEAGFPVNKELKGNDEIYFKVYPATRAISAKHTGDYETYYITYNKIQKYIEQNDLILTGRPREIYITDPAKEPDRNKWETNIIFPVE